MEYKYEKFNLPCLYRRINLSFIVNICYIHTLIVNYTKHMFAYIFMSQTVQHNYDNFQHIDSENSHRIVKVKVYEM